MHRIRRSIIVLLALIIIGRVFPVAASADDQKGPTIFTWAQLQEAFVPGEVSTINLTGSIAAGDDDTSLVVGENTVVNLYLNDCSISCDNTGRSVKMNDLILVKEDGILRIFGPGTISLTDGNNTIKIRDTGYVELNGGTITSDNCGDTVLILKTQDEESPRLVMKGGTVTAAKLWKGGYTIHDSGVFIMEGGTVSGNRIGIGVEYDSTIKLGGPVSISSIHFVNDEADEGKITFYDDNAKPLSNSWPIAISKEKPGVFTDGLPGNGSDSNFTSTDPDYIVSTNDDGEALLTVKPMYDVNIATNIEHGSVTADVNKAYKNQRVTLSVVPDPDYVPKTVSYTYNNGTEDVTEIIAPSRSAYSFYMPAADVTVNAEFEVETLTEGAVWWKYDSRNKILYISDEENKGDDYNLFRAEDQQAAKISADEHYGWICQCEDAVKVVIQGTPEPAETKYWFHRMSDLKSIENLDDLDTSKVTNMHFMFGVCRSLEELDLSGFDTSNVKDMSNMFYECTGLKKLDLTDFNTSRVTSMASMFNQCNSLTSVNLTGLDTSQVTDMSSMFYHCVALEYVDLNSFDVTNVTDMTWMFNTCSSLKTIYAKEGTDWSGTSINMDNMFNGCDVLTGGEGTAYDSSHIPKTYARVDDPNNGKPGYFTAGEPEPDPDDVTYEVSFNANGHGTAPETQTVKKGKRAAEPSPAPQEDGWIFGGWFDNADCTGEPFDFKTRITDDLELFAKWTAENTDPEPAPDTGDSSGIELWITLLALSMTTVAVTYKKKKTYID